MPSSQLQEQILIVNALEKFIFEIGLKNKEVKHYSGMPAASLTLGIISILTIIFW